MAERRVKAKECGGRANIVDLLRDRDGVRTADVNELLAKVGDPFGVPDARIAATTTAAADSPILPACPPRTPFPSLPFPARLLGNSLGHFRAIKSLLLLGSSRAECSTHARARFPLRVP
jgi:hypothetical protein